MHQLRAQLAVGGLELGGRSGRRIGCGCGCAIGGGGLPYHRVLQQLPTPSVGHQQLLQRRQNAGFRRPASASASTRASTSTSPSPSTVAVVRCVQGLVRRSHCCHASLPQQRVHGMPPVSQAEGRLTSAWVTVGIGWLGVDGCRRGTAGVRQVELAVVRQRGVLASVCTSTSSSTSRSTSSSTTTTRCRGPRCSRCAGTASHLGQQLLPQRLHRVIVHAGSHHAARAGVRRGITAVAQAQHAVGVTTTTVVAAVVTERAHRRDVEGGVASEGVRQRAA